MHSPLQQMLPHNTNPLTYSGFLDEIRLDVVIPKVRVPFSPVARFQFVIVPQTIHHLLGHVDATENKINLLKLMVPLS